MPRIEHMVINGRLVFPGCPICVSPEREDLERDSIDGLGYKRLARSYGLPLHTARQHVSVHMPYCARKDVQYQVYEHINSDRRSYHLPELRPLEALVNWKPVEPERTDSLTSAKASADELARVKGALVKVERDNPSDLLDARWLVENVTGLLQSALKVLRDNGHNPAVALQAINAADRVSKTLGAAISSFETTIIERQREASIEDDPDEHYARLRILLSDENVRQVVRKILSEIEPTIDDEVIDAIDVEAVPA